MSKQTRSKKTASKKTTTKTTKKTHRPTMAERADAAARAAEALEASGQPAETVLKTRAFPGAVLPPKAKKVAAPKAEKPANEPRVTVTSVAEGLIRDGRTDEEVLEALAKQFSDFDPAKKRHYPSWYRARLVRREVITASFAEAHRHAKEEVTS